MKFEDLLRASLLIETAKQFIDEVDGGEFTDIEGHDLRMMRSFKELKGLLGQ